MKFSLGIQSLLLQTYSKYWTKELLRATCLNSTKEKGVETLAAHRSDQEAESM